MMQNIPWTVSSCSNGHEISCFYETVLQKAALTPYPEPAEFSPHTCTLCL
jgi:hypothetical protein